MTTVVYIHGANATGESFNYIRQFIQTPSITLEYNSTSGFAHNLADMKTQLAGIDQLFFVAHSLGGIYATHLADHFADQTRGGVTISTPYGGCREADMVRLFLPFSRLMQDIGPDSWPMRTARDIKYSSPWTNIVSTRGNSPFINDDNDGVVTLSSMRAHADAMDLIDSHYNHYEILLSYRTVEIVAQALLDK